MSRFWESLFLICSPNTEASYPSVHEALYLLAPPAGFEPATCGLGSLYRFPPATTSDISARETMGTLSLATKGNCWRRESDVHSQVHSPSDIHPTILRSPQISLNRDTSTHCCRLISLRPVPLNFHNAEIVTPRRCQSDSK